MGKTDALQTPAPPTAINVQDVNKFGVPRLTLDQFHSYTMRLRGVDFDILIPVEFSPQMRTTIRAGAQGENGPVLSGVSQGSSGYQAPSCSQSPSLRGPEVYQEPSF